MTKEQPVGENGFEKSEASTPIHILSANAVSITSLQSNVSLEESIGHTY